MENRTVPFQVTWDRPEDATAMWVLNEAYNLRRMSRLDFDLRTEPMIEGRNVLNGVWGIPFRTAPRLINGFAYQKLIVENLPPEAMSESMKGADVLLRRAGRDIGSEWEKTWLPEIKSHLAELTAFDLAGASLPALLQHVAAVKGRLSRLWVVHFHVQDPAILAVSDFDDAYRSLFPDAKPFESYELLAGFPNKTLETNIRLWELGRAASRTPALRALIVSSDPARLPAALAESPAGQALWQKIQEYLSVYGERSDDLYADTPTWIDDPTPVLRGLREAVLQAERDLAEELPQQKQRRESRLVEVRAQLASHPRPVVEEFESLLKTAEAGIFISEEHHFWLDCKISYHARRASLEAGRRLVAAGVLAKPGDVFELTLAELVALAAPGAPTDSLRALVSERQAEAARFVGVTPPPFLGVPQPLPAMDSAFMMAGFKYGGSFMAPPSQGNELRGVAGSRGKVVGPARIVRSIEEAEKLRRGDILVAPATLPSWTPFFATAAALVTNVGGALSHAAVVAREYGIPAVVGARGATEALQDGQIIEVDGDAGVVRFEVSAPSA